MLLPASHDPKFPISSSAVAWRMETAQPSCLDHCAVAGIQAHMFLHGDTAIMRGSASSSWHAKATRASFDVAIMDSDQ